MPEMTREMIGRMDLQSIAQAFLRAYEYDSTNKAITWEHGTDIVNIVAIHGETIGEVLHYAEERHRQRDRLLAVGKTIMRLYGPADEDLGPNATQDALDELAAAVAECEGASEGVD